MTLDHLTHAARPADDLYALPEGELSPRHIVQALVLFGQSPDDPASHPTARRFHSLNTPSDTFTHCPQLGIPFTSLPMCQ